MAFLCSNYFNSDCNKRLSLGFTNLFKCIRSLLKTKIVANVFRKAVQANLEKEGAQTVYLYTFSSVNEFGTFKQCP